jgi:small-conductance mechanosensitive channel
MTDAASAAVSDAAAAAAVAASAPASDLLRQYGVPAAASFSDFGAWFDELMRPSSLAELAVLALVVGMAFAFVRWLRARSSQPRRVWFGDRGFDGVLFPVLALLGALAARHALTGVVPIAVFRVAVPVLLSLALIRIGVRVLRVAFPESVAVRAVERSISWFVWGLLVLWLTGLLPLVMSELELVHWKVGGVDVSLRSLLEGAISAVAVMVLMLWLSAGIEAYLLKEGVGNLSVRKIAANATRAILLLVGILLALSAAGIPLAALSVLGGAVGVGIGLGLQKLAANYVSGFVILAERSLRIGDVVKLDGFEGRISDIHTRYTLIRALNGRESIVPNEMLITQRVENLTAADPKVSLSTTVVVAYGTDLTVLLPELVKAIADVPRVIADPAPNVQVSNLAADGIELATGFWIADPENGQGNARSDVNLAVLACLARLGAQIPYPQRDVRLEVRRPAR